MTALLLCLLLIGCAEKPKPWTNPEPLPTEGERGFVISFWEQTGAFGVIEGASRKVWPMLGPTSSDAVARYFEGRIYVINRYTHDNLQIMDATTLGLIKQVSVGAGSNPQDLAVHGKDIWLTRLNEPSLARLDRETGAIVGTVDLTELSETGDKRCLSASDCGDLPCLRGSCARDGLPEISAIYPDGERLIIAAQRLDRTDNFASKDRGLLAFFDLTTQKVVKTVETAAGNPQGLQPSPDGRLLYVGQTGRWLEPGTSLPRLDGGIEAFERASGVSRGWVLKESDLGGNLSGFVIASDQGFALRSGQDWQTDLVAFSLQTGQITALLARSACIEQTACFSFFQIALSRRGELYLVDRNPQAPGIRIFDTQTHQELTPKPLDLGLPPSFLLFYP